MKNWLIRTRNNRILGPITKDKLIELYDTNSLTDEDELSSGNGYWFFLKEKDLFDKYVKGDAIQSFNPVSEAQIVINQKTEEVLNSEDGTVKLPNKSDLDYPDM